MKSRVIAIGLDSAEPRLLEKWMAEGHLPNLSKLRETGAYSRLENTVDYAGGLTEQSATEASWTAFLTGCSLDKVGYWGTVKYHADRCEATKNNEDGSYYFDPYKPFYAQLNSDYKVITFDIPTAKPVQGVNGIQVQDWGGHFPFSTGWSQPSNLISDINQTHGKNPVLLKDHGYWWNENYIQDIQQRMWKSIEKRAEICCDLLKKEPWDLFVTTFIDTHSASHSIWHLSESTGHPLFQYVGKEGSDPLLKTFQLIDSAIGKILAEVPDDTHVVCFSVHGMGNNVTDLNSMAFLPEVLYRYNFPGKIGIASEGNNSSVPPIITKPLGKGWSGITWRQKYEPNPIKRFFRKFTPARYLKDAPDSDWISPAELDEIKDPLSRMPAEWLKKTWPKMKAFAIPSFSDGHIRINLKGREKYGIVSLSEYDEICDELVQLLLGLTNPRTGEAIVDKVVRTRKSPSQKDDKSLPDADLIVKWRENVPVDVVDSPNVGRIGPLPFYRTGGHRASGFIIANGPKVDSNLELNSPHLLDLTPTIMGLLGASIPEHFDGKPLFEAVLSV